MAALAAGLVLGALLNLAAPAVPARAQTAPAVDPAAVAAIASQIDGLPFRSAVEERRFRSLLDNMRCLQYPHKSLAESIAPQASEMRMTVFRMLQDNRADLEIRMAMVDIYGEEVLYQSAFAGHRVLIWFGPVLLLVVGLIAAFIVSMKKRRPARQPAR